MLFVNNIVQCRIQYGHQGFTLIELIIVIVLVAALSIVIVSMNSNTNQTLISADAFSQQLANDLRYVQTWAQARNEILTIRFDTNRFIVTDPHQQTLTLPSNNTSVPDGININTSGLVNNTLEFHAEGSPYSNVLPLNASVNIALQENGVTLKTLKIMPQTGRIHVE